MSKQETTKERIFKVAARLFSELGYENTSMRLIASETKITKPAIYYHFPNKQALYESLIFEAFTHMRKIWEVTRNSRRNPIEKLHKLVKNRFDATRDYPEITQFIYDAISGHITCDLSFDIMAEFEQHRNILVSILHEGQESGLFRQDIDEETFVLGLMGTINMYVISYLKYNNPLTDEQSRALVDTFLYGIINRKREG